MSLRLMLRMGLVVVLALGLMVSASASTTGAVSAHGGDTTLGHACAESTSLFLNLVVTPGLVPAGTLDCTTLGPGWFNYDTGDISRVAGAAGSGITGGAASGEATLGTDPNVLQRRVTGTCPVGQAIRVVASTGLVTCQAAGGGIGGGGTLNSIPRFTGPAAIGDSIMSQSGDDILFSTSDLSSLNFPNTVAPNAPMIQMFQSGSSNADRMVIAHSPSFPTWGLQYQDVGDNFVFRTTGSETLRVNLSGQMVGIRTNSPTSQLTMNGTIGFENGTTPLLINQESGTNTGNRMIWAHSPGFIEWGVRYDDNLDRMYWQQDNQAANRFMTVNFGAQRLEVESLVVTSDRNAKKDFAPVDRRDVLDRLSEIPIETWTLKQSDPSVRHLGPTAQDFHAAFGLGGDDDTHIATTDSDGVSLVAIQELYKIVQEKDAQIAVLQKLTEDLELRLNALEQTAWK